MRMQVQSLALLSGLISSVAESCGVDCRRSSDPMLLWLWLQLQQPQLQQLQLQFDSSPGNLHMLRVWPPQKTINKKDKENYLKEQSYCVALQL